MADESAGQESVRTAPAVGSYLVQVRNCGDTALVADFRFGRLRSSFDWNPGDFHGVHVLAPGSSTEWMWTAQTAGRPGWIGFPLYTRAGHDDDTRLVLSANLDDGISVCVGAIDITRSRSYGMDYASNLGFGGCLVRPEVIDGLGHAFSFRAISAAEFAALGSPPRIHVDVRGNAAARPYASYLVRVLDPDDGSWRSARLSSITGVDPTPDPPPPPSAAPQGPGMPGFRVTPWHGCSGEPCPPRR